MSSQSQEIFPSSCAPKFPQYHPVKLSTSNVFTWLIAINSTYNWNSFTFTNIQPLRFEDVFPGS